MSKEELRRSLDALEAELANVSAETSVKARITHLIEDIERQIGEPESSEHHLGFEHGEMAQQKLPTLIEQFEADHPRVTENLNSLMVTLSGMGI